MEEFIDGLKVRQQEAVRQLQVAQVELQHAQNKFNLLSQRANALNVILSGEMQKVAQEQQATARAAVSAGRPAEATPAILVAPTPTAMPNAPDAPNKTELVRGVLRQRPNGVRPAEIANELKNQQVSTAYVHSVLHRLMDREVTRKRGKYFLKQNAQPQSEEVTGHNGIVQQH